MACVTCSNNTVLFSSVQVCKDVPSTETTQECTKVCEEAKVETASKGKGKSMTISFGKGKGRKLQHLGKGKLFGKGKGKVAAAPAAVCKDVCKDVTVEVTKKECKTETKTEKACKTEVSMDCKKVRKGVVQGLLFAADVTCIIAEL